MAGRWARRLCSRALFWVLCRDVRQQPDSGQEFVLQVPFLNLMSNLVKRAGEVRVRVGGNTQETAKLVDTLPDGKMLAKDIENASNPTQTPPLDYTRDLFTIMSAISLVNVRWSLGIPFFDTNPFDLSFPRISRAILGDKLLGMQAGNELDMHSRHGHRNSDYAPQNYYHEVGALIAAMGDDARNILIRPNLANAEWQPQQIWDTCFVDSYSDSVALLSFEHYPNNNCFAHACALLFTFMSTTMSTAYTNFGVSNRCL
ncbi:glycoside hydrolase family 79 protein [Cylindrobasidium torrendii FP15055 ss-10]|uniref:Glycoside hydrolase family 79 protein n=1 Tax=Cylindrobasidium torrendii FP15055 ss-10 TaxID=1314674 RepID=A0A0D7AV14_9AGAR|nr:glycoside hydrolase family 79 protein [Cylindrobasidium torrendii FP15055 ss-10]